MRPIGRRIAVCAAVTVAGLGLVACGDGEDSATSKIDSIGDAVNDAVKLEGELYQAVNRLVIDCMEEQDFDIHPQWMTEDYSDGEEEYSPLDDTQSPDSRDMPTAKDATKEGFGQNIFMKSGYSDPDMEEDEPDPFYEESQEYQEAYEKAQYGDEYYEWMYADPGDDGVNMEAAPLEGGCSGDVGKKVYGKPIVPDPKDEDGEGMTSYYGVEWPDALGDWEKQEELYHTDKLLDARDKFSKCVEDEGYPYFEYTKGWGLGLAGYVDGFYDENTVVAHMGSEGSDVPPEYDLPKGAPWKDFDKAFAAEVALATAAAECADDTGFREASEMAWKNAIEKSVLDGEKEIYAWYDDLKAALDKAQDLIGK